MRKMIFSLLFIGLLVLAVWSVVKGVNTNVLAINSFSTIQKDDDKLESLIKEASKQKNEKYKSALEELQVALKKLKSSEETYQQLLDLGIDENGIPLSKIQEYEMEKIWITIGNHAKKEGVDLKIDVTVNNSVAQTYDLNFTVTGKYVQIADFLYDVQRDKTLVFKIENFKLVPFSESDSETSTSTDKAQDGKDKKDEKDEITDLVATFVCKDIKLNIIEQSTEETEEDADKNESTTEETDTTESTT